MSYYNEEHLKAKIRAVNRANAYAEQLSNTLIPIFKELIGKKVKKVGGLTIKVKSLLPDFPHSPEINVYYHDSNYSVFFIVKVSEMIGNSCTCLYYELTLNIGKLDGGILTEVYEQFKATSYNLEDIKNKIEVCKNAQRALDSAKDDLGIFADFA
jgi:hypothetical protein